MMSCAFFFQEVDEEDEKAFKMFLSGDAPSRRTLAEVIMEKIQDKKTEIESQMTGMLIYWKAKLLYPFNSFSFNANPC